MHTPPPSSTNGHLLPYVIVADAIFGLKRWLMKLYPGKGLNEAEAIFNYRLSRARRTIENAFGILAARWCIFRKPIKANPILVDSIVKVCLCLHNYLRLTDNAQYLSSGFVDSEDSSGQIAPGDWRPWLIMEHCNQPQQGMHLTDPQPVQKLHVIYSKTILIAKKDH